MIIGYGIETAERINWMHWKVLLMTTIWKIFSRESITLKCTWKISPCYYSENVHTETSIRTSSINCSKSWKIHARRSAELWAMIISSFTLKKQKKWIIFSLIMTYTQSTKMFLGNQFTLWIENLIARVSWLHFSELLNKKTIEICRALSTYYVVEFSKFHRKSIAQKNFRKSTHDSLQIKISVFRK